jgi:hypothetical protein
MFYSEMYSTSGLSKKKCQDHAFLEIPTPKALLMDASAHILASWGIGVATMFGEGCRGRVIWEADLGFQIK